jgi:PEP-CTERM motif-containing protein
MKLRLLILGVVGLALHVAPVPAGTVYNTYGPGDAYDFGAGATIRGSFVGGYTATGLQFTPSSSGLLSSIDFSVGYVSGTNSITLSLYTSTGSTTGALLETWSVTNLPNFGQNVAPLTVVSSSHPLLTSGSNYILFAAPGANNTLAAWDYNPTLATGSAYFSFASPGTNGGVSTNTLPAVRINVEDDVSATPEPASVTLLGIGIAGMAGYGWRRRRSTAA